MTQPPQQPPPKGPPPADGPRPPETPPESGKPEPSDKPDKLLVPPPRRLWLIVMLAFAVTIGLYLSSSDENAGPEIDYTAFYSHAEKGEVEKVRLEGRRLEGVFRTEQTIGERKLKAFRTRLPQLEDEDLLPMLRKQGVVVQVREETGGLTSVISLMLPWLLLGGFGWWLLNKNRSVGGTPPFGPMMTSPAKRFEVQEKVLVTF
ncbi:MAG: ATP-dependent metallopeptidase FtsH/Yme1/Tma family protein, partial [Myxococcales bacterium]|nr:ATP-dependent metallopeptidase FtsH/Yme1/Tma family protein [Myxococcales bacterium]